MKLAPMPWILFGPATPLVSRGEDSGSTATTRVPGLRVSARIFADPGHGPAGADAADERVQLRNLLEHSPGRWCGGAPPDWRGCRTGARGSTSRARSAASSSALSTAALHAARRPGSGSVRPRRPSAGNGAPGSWCRASPGRCRSPWRRPRRPGRCRYCRWWPPGSPGPASARPLRLGVLDDAEGDAVLDAPPGLALSSLT